MSRRAYIFSGNETVRAPLLFWLEDHGFNRHRDIVEIHEPRDQCVAYSAGIRKAIDDKVDMAVFCDSDALPSAAKTDVFFKENKYHLQCVRYETESLHSFDRHDAFHSLIWRASREVLLKIEQNAIKTGTKLCEWLTSEDGSMITECACKSIARHAKQCGLSTGWIGNAGHAPRTKPLVPRICIYGA